MVLQKAKGQGRDDGSERLRKTYVADDIENSVDAVVVETNGTGLAGGHDSAVDDLVGSGNHRVGRREDKGEVALSAATTTTGRGAVFLGWVDGGRGVVVGLGATIAWCWSGRWHADGDGGRGSGDDGPESRSLGPPTTEALRFGSWVGSGEAGKAECSSGNNGGGLHLDGMGWNGNGLIENCKGVKECNVVWDSNE